MDPSVTSLADARDRRRLDPLYDAHYSFLLGLARKLCRSHFDPEDLVQDTLEKAVHHLHELPADANHRAWMARVLTNLFLDRARRRAARPVETAIDDDAVASTAPDARAWWEDLDADAVRAKVRELPPELREAFTLFAFEGRSYVEIAAQLGIAKATVGTRVLRARRRLKALFTGAAEGGDE